MQKLTKIALSIFCTLVASNVFAQCPAGSPCAQRNAGYYNDDNNYDNSYQQRPPAYRQQYNRPTYSQNPGYGYQDQYSYPGNAQGNYQQYTSAPNQYQTADRYQIADDSSMSGRPMTPPNQETQGYMSAPSRNNMGNAPGNGQMMNQAGNRRMTPPPSQETTPFDSANPQGY